MNKNENQTLDVYSNSIENSLKNSVNQVVNNNLESKQ